MLASTPAAGSLLATAPTFVELQFSEPLEPESWAQVVDVQGQSVHQGSSQRVASDAYRLRVELPALPDGVYTIRWDVVSAADGHASRGTVAFAIGDETVAQPLVLPPVPDNPLAPPPVESVLIRWLTVCVLMLVGGALWFARTIGQEVAAITQPPIVRHRFLRWYWIILISALTIGTLVTLVVLIQTLQSGGWEITGILGSRSTRIVMFRWLRAGPYWCLLARDFIAVGGILERSSNSGQRPMDVPCCSN